MSWTEIGGIKSETSRSRVYSIEVNDDGDLRCSCASWIHSFNPKSCKHTMSAEAGRLLRAYQERTRPRPHIPSEPYGIADYLRLVRRSKLEQVEGTLRAARAVLHQSTFMTRLNLERELRELGF